MLSMLDKPLISLIWKDPFRHDHCFVGRSMVASIVLVPHGELVQDRITVRRVEIKVVSLLHKFSLNLIACHWCSKKVQILVKFELSSVKIGSLLQSLFNRRCDRFVTVLAEYLVDSSALSTRLNYRLLDLHTLHLISSIWMHCGRIRFCYAPAPHAVFAIFSCAFLLHNCRVG